MAYRQRQRDCSEYVPWTYIPEILHVAHEVSFGVDDLVDSFLTLLLCIGHARDDLRGDSVNPQRAGFLCNITKTIV